MKTPQEFTNNLKNNIITTEMLNACLYSVNKRAKNYRDAKRKCNKYGRYANKYKNSAEYKENTFYDKKEKLLSIIEPTCIHKELIGYEKTRIYDYQKDFDKQYLKALLLNQVAHTNTYYNYDIHEEIFFFDCYDFSKPKYLYFIFYELGTKSYHTPIDDPSQYKLPIETIGRLNTTGDDYHDLISVQFVDKVIDLIESNQYTYKETEPTIKQTYDNEIPNYNTIDDEPDYYDIDEIRHLLNTYVKQEITKQYQQICQNEKYEIKESDFKIQQKYHNKKHIYKYPKIKSIEYSEKITYQLTTDLIEQLRNIVKQPNFTTTEIANVICNTLPYDIYKNYYMNKCISDTKTQLQTIADEKYEQQEDNQKPLELTIQDIIDIYKNTKEKDIEK